MSHHTSLLVTLVGAFFAIWIFAHYLWITVDNKSFEYATKKIHFERCLSASEGQHLNSFNRLRRTQIRTLQNDEDYQLKRNHATLVMNLPSAEESTRAKTLLCPTVR